MAGRQTRPRLGLAAGKAGGRTGVDEQAAVILEYSGERQASITISVVYGTPASTGSEAPPNPASGCVPLYLIDLSYGQTAITNMTF